MKLLHAALAASLMGVALAPTAAEAQAQSLRRNMVQGWKVINDQTLIVTDRVGRQYDVALKKGCTGLDWPNALGFGTGLRGDLGITCLTRNDFVTVAPNGGTPRQRCTIASVVALNSR